MFDAASTLVAFGGSGLPDTDWLGCHERSARARGDVLTADALLWIIRTFERVVVLNESGTHAVAGTYRLFEFIVAREGSRASIRASAEQVEAFRNGDVTGVPTASGVFAEEVNTCMGNFTALTNYAKELAHLSPRQQWRDTVSAQVPADMTEFSDAYLRTLSAIPDGGEHSTALQGYSAALNAMHRASVHDFDASAGTVHAHRVMLSSR